MPRAKIIKKVPESSRREFRKFSRGGKEKTANGIGWAREPRRLSELWRGNPEKSNGDSKLETTRKLALASTHNPDQRRGNDVR
jgi:hypothetical protein